MIELFEQRDIKNLKQLTSDLKITNTSVDTDNRQVRWTTSKAYNPDDITA